MKPATQLPQNKDAQTASAAESSAPETSVTGTNSASADAPPRTGSDPSSGNGDPDHSGSNGASTWAQTPLGRLIDQRERELVASVLPRLYNPVCVQVGWLGGSDVMGSTEAALKILVAEGEGAEGEVSFVAASPTALPFGERSVDLALLVHVLDFSSEPHQVLREVDQTLASDGHIVIVGFNPLSLWGLRRQLSWLFRGRTYRPFKGAWLRQSRVQDWLTLLGYETTGGARGVYTLPFQAPRLAKRFGFLERAGNRWWPRFGAVYVLVAKKREITGTPVQGWRRRRNALGRRLAVPVARADGATSGKTSAKIIQWKKQ